MATLRDMLNDNDANCFLSDNDGNGSCGVLVNAYDRDNIDDDIKDLLDLEMRPMTPDELVRYARVYRDTLLTTDGPEYISDWAVPDASQSNPYRYRVIF